MEVITACKYTDTDAPGAEEWRGFLFEIPVRNLYSSDRSPITEKTAREIVMLLNGESTAAAFGKILTGTLSNARKLFGR